MAPARAKRGRGLEFLQHRDSWHGLASIQSWARSWLAPMGKGGRDTPKPAASRAVRHLADGAASHSQHPEGRRGCAARLQLVAGAPRPSPKARARLARGPMGGQGTGHLQAVGSLISSVRQNPFLSGSPPCSPLLFPVQSAQCLSPFFDSILPTTHYPHPVRGTHRPPPNDSTRRRRRQMVEPINPSSTRRPDHRYR